MWDRILLWFKGSETIFIARMKAFLGLAFTAVQQSGQDLAAFFTDHPNLQIGIRVFFAYLIVDGTLGEWARRRGADTNADGTLK